MRYLCLLIGLGLRAMAQSHGNYSVTVELSRPAEGLQAEVMTVNRREILTRADMPGAALFELNGLPAGQVLLRLTNRWGESIAETVVAAPSFTPVRIQLPPAAGAAAPISLRRLQHSVPKEAWRWVERARKERNKGDWEKARAGYGAARERDPECFEALFEGGLVAMQRKDYGEAAGLFEAAEAIDQTFAPLLTHRGIVEYAEKRAARALEYARRALRFAPDDRRAHYLAGISMHALNRRGGEWEGHLRAAARDFPQALELLRAAPK